MRLKTNEKNSNKRTNIKCGIALLHVIQKKRAKLRTDKMKCNPNDNNKGTKACTSDIIAITPDKDFNKKREL